MSLATAAMDRDELLTQAAWYIDRARQHISSAEAWAREPAKVDAAGVPLGLVAGNCHVAAQLMGYARATSDMASR